MKFGIPQYPTRAGFWSWVRFVFLVSVSVIFGLIVGKKEGGWFGLILVGVIIVSWIAFLLLIIVKNKKNRDKPLFEITDDKLLIKGDYGNITEYPLSSFKGVIKTKGIVQQYLYAPGFRAGMRTKYIPISVLHKEERKSFLKALESKIENPLNNAIEPDRE